MMQNAGILSIDIPPLAVNFYSFKVEIDLTLQTTTMFDNGWMFTCTL